VTLFGSTKTGLCLPTSDIDLTVSLPEASWGSSPTLVLAEALRARHVCERLQVISNARVPIVKMWDAKTRAAVDISFNASSGPATCVVVNDFAREFPQLRPLSFVLKYFLHLHCLNEPYLGGIGSYTLILMIVSFLQVSPLSALPRRFDL
jgi:non-canonical poly(A) RNA polymerase PAPD5/7